jgi:hypothetical protein
MYIDDTILENDYQLHAGNVMTENLLNIRKRAAGYCNCDTIIDTLSALKFFYLQDVRKIKIIPSVIVEVIPPIQFTARWIASDTNNVPTESEILAWSNTALFDTGGQVNIPFNNFIGTPKFLKWAQPKTELPKTKYYINVLDNDVLGPNSTWNTGITVGQWDLYMPNGATETDNVSTQFKVS